MKGKVTRQGTHLYRQSKMSWAVLGGLGRSWAILAGLDLIHFIDKSRSGTEVTAKPLERAKENRRKEGTE